MLHEYLHIVSDPAHILAELTYIALFDIVIGAMLWPLIKRAVRRHDRDEHGIDRIGPDFFEEDA